MRHLLIISIALALLVSIPAPAQSPSSPEYTIDIDKGSVFRVTRDDDRGQKQLYVTVKFKINRPDGDKVELTGSGEEFIVVRENGTVVERRPLVQFKSQSLTTVLVLDQSGSMRKPANDTDKDSKIAALRNAASRYVDLMPERARTTLLPFSSTVTVPRPFTSDKAELKEAIARLEPEGGTLLYDAAYAGIETLAAARPEGSKFVVVLTDGKDESPGSRHSPDELIQRAHETDVKVYMLGFGRKNEINETVMTEIAEQTGGEYYHAENQERLYKLFDQLATEFQTNYTVTFPSRNPQHDGTARGIDITIERGGKTISNEAQVDVAVHGVVVPLRDGAVYLSLLVLLGGLLLVPAGMRKMFRAVGGK
jgi:VWFA-related protein